MSLLIAKSGFSGVFAVGWFLEKVQTLNRLLWLLWLLRRPRLRYLYRDTASQGSAMSDDAPFPVPDTTPIERNARKLVDVLARYFPEGVTTEDLRRQYELETGFGRQTFYNALSYAKERQWIVGGGDQGKLNCLSPNGSWKPPAPRQLEWPVEQLKHVVSLQMAQIEELQGENRRLLDGIAGENVAISALVRIVADNAVSTPRRLRAAAAVLGYKVSDASIVEFVRRFLESVCAGTDTHVDHKIEAGELLRKHEAPRVMSEIVRPTYREDEKVDPEEARRQREEVYRRRIAHLERQAALDAAELEKQRAARLAASNGGG